MDNCAQTENKIETSTEFTDITNDELYAVNTKSLVDLSSVVRILVIY